MGKTHNGQRGAFPAGRYAEPVTLYRTVSVNDAVTQVGIGAIDKLRPLGNFAYDNVIYIQVTPTNAAAFTATVYMCLDGPNNPLGALVNKWVEIESLSSSGGKPLLFTLENYPPCACVVAITALGTDQTCHIHYSYTS